MKYPKLVSLRKKLVVKNFEHSDINYFPLLPLQVQVFTIFLKVDADYGIQFHNALS